MNRPGSKRGRVGSLDERFWKKVRKTKTCWLWTASTIQNHSGALYGCMFVGPEQGHKMLAHRVSYELHYGPIPDGFTVDHLCRTTLCIRPAYLEAVTLRENILRGGGFSAVNAKKTRCPQRHPLVGDNLIINIRGDRGCRTCENTHQRAYRAKVARIVRERIGVAA